MSMNIAIGPVSHLTTQSLYAMLDSKNYGATFYGFVQKPKQSLCSGLLILVSIMPSPVGTPHLLSGWSISDASETRYGVV